MDQSSTDRGAVFMTGCSTGIGKSTALYLDNIGFQVFAGVRKATDADMLKSVASPRLTPVIVDVCNDQSIQAAFMLVSEAVGNTGLVGLINNAGVSHPGPLECVETDRIRQTMNVNLIGPMVVIQTFLPLIRRARGRIVNVGSIGGVAPMPFYTAYCASKSGVHGLTTALRRELRSFGIEVALIVPGNIKTMIWERGHSNLMELAQTINQDYRGAFEGCKVTLERMGQEGQPPEAVARTIAAALTDPKPKVRYFVGQDAINQERAETFLPARYVDAIQERLV